MRKAMLMGLATVVLVALPGLAGAQFFYRLNVNSIGATTCTTTQAQTALNGDVDWILPPSSNNLRTAFKVNGGGTTTTFESVTPFSFDNFAVATIVFALPVATPLPYTVSVERLPASNGTTVGTGFGATWNCDANGGGTFTLFGIAAPTAVPATSDGGLAALATLLALAGMALARRRARRRPIA